MATLLIFQMRIFTLRYYILITLWKKSAASLSVCIQIIKLFSHFDGSQHRRYFIFRNACRFEKAFVGSVRQHLCIWYKKRPSYTTAWTCTDPAAGAKINFRRQIQTYILKFHFFYKNIDTMRWSMTWWMCIRSLRNMCYKIIRIH